MMSARPVLSRQATIRLIGAPLNCPLTAHYSTIPIAHDHWPADIWHRK